MTTSLDTIRYHSGIAGEEVADMVDSLEQEISTLREQVEKLTEAYDQSWRTVQEYGRTIDQTESRLREVATHCANVEQQLAALEEQNEKMRKVLLRLACLGNGDQYGNSIGNCIAQEALSLPDLASPALNRIRAEGMKLAAEILDSPMDRAAAQKIIAKAAELEKTNGLPDDAGTGGEA